MEGGWPGYGSHRSLALDLLESNQSVYGFPSFTVNAPLSERIISSLKR